MARTKILAALTVIGVIATGCGPAARQANTGLYSVNQPVVEHTDYVLDIATGADGVPASELGRLEGWFQSLEVGYGDRIAIDEAGGYGEGSVREDVAAVAGRYGLLLSDGAPVTAGSVQPGTVRIVISRMTASVPSCPNWGGQELGGRSSTSPNYGCAINSNLAAMVADPNDLVLGQTSSGTGDPRATSRTIRSWRDAPATGRGTLPATTTTGGQ
jgi:pilus assembly protein CpaD